MRSHDPTLPSITFVLSQAQPAASRSGSKRWNRFGVRRSKSSPSFAPHPPRYPPRLDSEFLTVNPSFLFLYHTRSHPHPSLLPFRSESPKTVNVVSTPVTSARACSFHFARTHAWLTRLRIKIIDGRLSVFKSTTTTISYSSCPIALKLCPSEYCDFYPSSLPCT